MYEVSAVIGAAFGDEGKGLVTAALTKKLHSIASNPVIVVRHNGGAQAGHTVEHNGVKHVFHSMSSGTFITQSTMWGPEFLIDPLMVVRELQQLEKINKNHWLWAHDECNLVTPFDIITNCALEEKRNKGAHGSCGLGIFETVERSKVFPLKWKHLAHEDACRKVLEHIQHYYFPKRLSQLGLTLNDINEEDREFVDGKDIIDNFMMHALALKDYVDNSGTWVPDLKIDNMVFEGAQGLMLDQNNLEMWPHLTPSNTGLENVGAMLNELSSDPVQVNAYYVSRVYMTRHGNGPLPNELPCTIGEPDLTNVTNMYQGGLRYAFLDLDLLKKHIDVDLKKFAVKYAHKAKFNIVLTHANLLLDPMHNIRVRADGHEIPVGDINDLAYLVLIMMGRHYNITYDNIYFSIDRENILSATEIKQNGIVAKDIF